jgi:hypothetical protein
MSYELPVPRTTGNTAVTVTVVTNSGTRDPESKNYEACEDLSAKPMAVPKHEASH